MLAELMVMRSRCEIVDPEVVSTRCVLVEHMVMRARRELVEPEVRARRVTVGHPP